MRRVCLVASSSRRSLVLCAHLLVIEGTCLIRFCSSTLSAGRIRHPYLELGQRSLFSNVERHTRHFGGGKFIVNRTGVRTQTAFSSLHARAFSTNPTPDTSSSASSQTAPPLAQNAKKQKVELRPGPVKVDAPTKTSKQAATPTPKAVTQPSSTITVQTTKRQPPSSTSFGKETLKEIEGKSILEQTKSDIEDGTRHGILAPPPADAGMARKLLHQAKELFVS